jgi:hypothetical protein
MPIIDKYKDMGTVVMGKLESGTIREGDSLLVMPNRVCLSYLNVTPFVYPFDLGLLQFNLYAMSLVGAVKRESHWYKLG